MAKPQVIEPLVYTAEEAADALRISKSYFVQLTQLYPDRLSGLTYRPGGDRRWSKEQIAAFKAWREQVGAE